MTKNPKPLSKAYSGHYLTAHARAEASVVKTEGTLCGKSYNLAIKRIIKLYRKAFAAVLKEVE